MKPHVSILMVTSIDGRLHPSRFTNSPDGTRRDWSTQYEKTHASLHSDAWLVGRVTMAEMSKAAAHPPARPLTVRRPIHVARADAVSYIVAEQGDVDLAAALDVLAREFGIKHLVVEGGAVTNGAFLGAGLV